jgi:2-C-methyl-D-erythritol 4-phosphate cytidylyltransferase / 2-C-methyl-D-erythritol 2,4-cyclodiphosphate synthase
VRCCAIIVAAGEGRRLGGLPKPYRLLGGKPLLVRSLEVFERAACCDSIVVVVAPERLEAAAALLASAAPRKLAALCPGGEERPASVMAGLAAVPEGTELCAVHDAARPLLAPRLVEALCAAAAESGAAIPVVSVRDTLRRAEAGQSLGWQDRAGLCLTQTPQVFRLELLRRAYARLGGRPPGTPLTDDAQLVEELGAPVQLVAGDPLNFKITEPADLAIAEQLLGAGGAPRTGLGYDVHRLVAGRRLVLGGVELAHPLGLLGHSDADVLCHAVGDALLGAAGLGDLGQHFPSSDPRWKGAGSLNLLTLIAEKLAEAGLGVANVDAMLICEAPPIAPHAARMRENLASVLRLPPGRVSVKATTNERLGFAGRGEGIACFATALLIPTHPDERLAGSVVVGEGQ